MGGVTHSVRRAHSRGLRATKGLDGPEGELAAHEGELGWVPLILALNTGFLEAFRINLGTHMVMDRQAWKDIKKFFILLVSWKLNGVGPGDNRPSTD